MTDVAPDLIDLRGWIPEDTFAGRLALVRARMQWNYATADRVCELKQHSWQRWESGRMPRNLLAVATKIADRSGCSREWLVLGGALAAPTISVWITAAENWVQDELDFTSIADTDDDQIIELDTIAPTRHLELVA